MMDVVFPNNNEDKFIEIAKRLGYTSLCFVYPLKEFCRKKLDFDIKYGILCNDKDIQKARKMSNLVFLKAGENQRSLIEKNKDIIIFGFEQSEKSDFLHQKRSNLNHILCSLATKNNIKIGFSFNLLLNSNENQRNVLIGRMANNIKLCKKYKTRMIFGSFAANPYEMRANNDLAALFNSLR